MSNPSDLLFERWYANLDFAEAVNALASALRVPATRLHEIVKDSYHACGVKAGSF
jgi:hypothetical protein